MSHPSTAREALIVEAIGDVARLLQRVEALRPALDDLPGPDAGEHNASGSRGGL